MNDLLGPQRADTDLYDEERNFFLINYSPLLILIIGLTGVAAFALTGFLGYANAVDSLGRVVFKTEQPLGYEFYFKQPWALFFWLCSLMIIMQMSIFRSPKLRRQRYLTLAASLISIIIVILVYFFRDAFLNLLNNLNYYLSLIGLRVGNGLLLAIINYGILAIFWIDSVNRWMKRARGEPIAPQVDIGLRFLRDPDRRIPTEFFTPNLPELISGDIIAAGVLSAALWGVFSPATLAYIWNNVFQVTGTPVCSGSCHIVDEYQMLLYFSVGLLALALTAVVNGLAALNAVETQRVAPIDTSVAGDTSTDKGTRGVVQTLVETLVGVFQRQWFSLVSNLALAVRNATWPFFILGATAALAALSLAIQGFLHGTSCLRGTYELGCQPLFHQAAFGDVTTLDIVRVVGYNGGVAIISAVVAVLGTIFAAALLVYQYRVVDNTLRFIRLTGFIVALTFWLFSLAMSVFNFMLYRFSNQTFTRNPFPFLGVLPGLSLGFLLVFGAIFFINRGRRQTQGPGGFIPHVGPRSVRLSTVGKLPDTASVDPAVAPPTVPAQATPPTPTSMGFERQPPMPDRVPTTAPMPDTNAGTQQ